MNMTTPKLGVSRRSMEDNQLLDRSQTGRHRSTPEHARGMTHGDPSGARRSSKSRSRSRTSTPTARPARPSTAPHEGSINTRNFLELNRIALSRGLVNAKDHQRLWETGAGPNVVEKRWSRPKSAAPYDTSQTFGRPSKPRAPNDTPKHTTTTQAGNEWLWDTLASQKMGESAERYGTRNFVRDPATTRTVELRRKGEIPDEEPMWQMKKFSNAKSKVSTFRTGTAKSRAHEQQAEEGLLRTGLGFSQGLRKNPGGQARNL